jgi:hypothetical protein
MGEMKMACFTRYTTLAAIFFSAFSYSSLSNARGVKSVTIEEVGKSSMEECSQFRPTEKQVKRFFSRAVPVQSRLVIDDWYSPCHADGTIVFTGGGSGKWRLYSGGTATLTWSTGSDVVYLYNGRNNGWHDPFECGYGYEDDEKGGCIIPGF